MHRLAGVHQVIQLISGDIRLRSFPQEWFNFRHSSYTNRHAVTPRCSDISVDSQSPCGWRKGLDIRLQD